MKFSIDIKETESAPHFTDQDAPEWTPEIARQEMTDWQEIYSKCNELRASLLDETEPMARKAIISPRFFRDGSGVITREVAARMIAESVAMALVPRVVEHLTSQAASTSPSTAASPAPPPGPASC
jgi:hypothetical protein